MDMEKKSEAGMGQKVERERERETRLYRARTSRQDLRREARFLTGGRGRG